MPHQTVGATTTGTWPAACSAAVRHTPSVRMVSTPTGRCGPCCSIEPTGRITIASAVAFAARSSPVNSFPLSLRSARSARLEGWPQTPSLLPSFETLARLGRARRQDDAECLHSFLRLDQAFDQQPLPGETAGH